MLWHIHPETFVVSLASLSTKQLRFLTKFEVILSEIPKTGNGLENCGPDLPAKPPRVAVCDWTHC
jgi:hypothetical protein